MLVFSKILRQFLKILAIFALLACSGANAPVGGPSAALGPVEGNQNTSFAGNPVGGVPNNATGDDQANANASPTSGAGFPDPALDVGYRSDLEIGAKTVECTFPPDAPKVTFEVEGRVKFPNNPEIQLNGRVFRIVDTNDNTYMDRELDADGHFVFQITTDFVAKMQFYLLHKSAVFSGHEEKIPCANGACSANNKRDMRTYSLTNPCLPDTSNFYIPPGGKLPTPDDDDNSTSKVKSAQPVLTIKP